MRNRHQTSGFDRRLFLAGSAAAVLLPRAGHAQPSGGTAMLSKRIAEFTVGFDLKAAPPLAIERARLAFIDTVGVMLAGSQEKAADIVRDMVKLEGAAPAAGVIGTALRTSPQLAALANGVATHALDFDLTYTQGQLTAPLIPALLPLAEANGATPAEVLAAYIVGFEVTSRLSRANPNHNGGGAWHGTGTIGTIGAAAASARLLKVREAAIPDVIGIAVSLASGVNANYGTMTKPLHNGNAARNGIVAAMLGTRGFTANPAAIEGRGGFARTFARGLTWDAKPFDDLGQQYDLAVAGFQPKRYPCGGVIHTGIDAALAIRDKLGAGVSDITAIHAGIARYAADRAKPDYPADTEAAKFNLQYVVGYSLARGVPKLASFDPPAINDPQVKALAQMVAVAIDPEFADAQQHYPTRVRVTLKDGRTVEETRYQPSGAPNYPMSQAQLEEKFMDCATHAVDKAAAEKILVALRTLGDQPSFDALWPLLRRG
jgi:2-methylcitrate dehydratase PrpD